MISGEMRSSITNANAFLIKTDPEGNEIWNKTYGGIGDDGFGVIRKTQNGGYILAGYTGGDQSTDIMNFVMGDAWLVKVDAEGNKEWDMIFGEFEMKSINSVRQTHDGGYLLAGRSGNKPQGSWIVKLTNDSASNNVSTDRSLTQKSQNELSRIWTKIYDSGSEIYAMQQTSDGGIVLAGMNFNNYKAVLIKTDSSGNELWNHTYKGGSDDRFYATTANHAMDETKDGGFILGGFVANDIYARHDPLLVKTDPSGKEEWNMTIGSNNENEDISAVLALDDGYILSSATWLIRTDNKGNQLWSKKYINSGIRDIKHAKDGGYIIIASEDGSLGYTGDFNPPTGWILRTDESGNEMWKKSFGEYPRKIVTPNSVLQTRDNEYIVVGDYSDHSNYIQDAWIIKFDKYGTEKWRRIIKNKSGPPPLPFYSFVDIFPSVVETMDGDYIIGGIINLYRTTGMDALIIKIDSNGTELWNMTAGGDGNQVVHSMQQTADGGLVFAGSMRNLNTEGHMGAMLMKVGKREENNMKLDDGDRAINMKHIEEINNTGTNHTNESLPEVRNNIQKPAPSFGFYIAALSIIALFLFKRRRR